MSAKAGSGASIPLSRDADELTIDIVINNYNYGRFLRDAVDSALQQTHPRVNVIVVDDGSTDSSRATLQSYGKEVELVLKENGGQASAVNAGFARARGDAVIFLDADDMLRPEAAALAAAVFASDPHVAKVQYRVEVIDREGNPRGIVKPPSHLPLPSGDLQTAELTFPFDIVWMPNGANAVRREILDQILPMPEHDFAECADWYLVHLPALFGRVVSLDAVASCYRVHGENRYELQEPSLDLNHIRKTVVYADSTTRALSALAHDLGLVLPYDRILSVADLANRLVSLKLEPDAHPIARDRVPTLAADGVRAARRRSDVSWPMKILFAGWFTIMSVAPPTLARRLAELLLIPERRESLNRGLRHLHKANRKVDESTGKLDRQRERFEIERELGDRLRRASKEERRGLYGTVYRERSARMPDHPLVRAATDPVQRAHAVAPQVRLLRSFVGTSTIFAELGAGDGAVARAVAPNVDRSIALDVTDSLWNPNGTPSNLEFIEFDGMKIPLAAASVDVVYTNDVIEHVHPDDLLDQMIAIRKVLKPSGCYVCVTPNRLSGPHDISRLFSAIPQGFHLCEYTVTELVQVLRRAGFRRIEITATFRGFALSPRFDARILAPVERVIELFPSRLRVHVARPLAALKVIAHA